MNPDSQVSGLLVSLTRPRWVGWLVGILLCIASLSLVTATIWSGWGIAWAIPIAMVPFVVHWLGQRRTQAIIQGRILVIWPDKPWQLSFFSEVSGLTDSIEVIVNKRWHHFLGISLGLKLQNHPHNKVQTITTVVWRHGMSSHVYREVALQAARQIELAGFHNKGDAA
ncbi:hypothetical protein [Zwartia sp.]|uniref:hypothetical protein n=1 Tax=Zwartia sp. TaxID=2978004 RepID=UPI00271E47CF|nr:hypothetical protein [Zwartia sp.]MDO9026071.1 hypothetical protein [Zwartia sp.]